MAYAQQFSGSLYTDFDYQSPIFETSEFGDFDDDPPSYSPYAQGFYPTHQNRHQNSISYQNALTPRYENIESYQQSQGRHQSIPSNHARHSNNMNNNHYQLLSPQIISGTRSSHDPPWSPIVSPQSLQNGWMDERHDMRPHSNSASSGSTNTSKNSNSSSGTRHSQNQSQGHRHSGSHSSTARNTHTNTQSSSSPPSSNGSQRPACYHEECIDQKTGMPLRTFSRKADLLRHEKCAHNPTLFDCPFQRCERRGDHGFTRKDHLTEHMRGYHGQHIVKRGNRTEERKERDGAPSSGRHAK